MPATTYTYSVSTDTANGVVAGDALDSEIRKSAIIIALDGVTVLADDLKVEFKDALSTGDKITLDGLVSTHQGIPLAMEATLVSITPLTTGSTPTIVTPNWCDKSTWYYTSLRVTGESLTDSGNLTTWTSAHTFWIDMSHGRITQDHSVNGTDRSVKIYVNSVLKIENSLDAQTGDYTVNYATGAVTFNAALTGGDVVTADYNYAVDSMWKMVPPAGKVFSLRAVEVQFSLDVELTDTAIFAPFGPIDIFAPQLLQSNGGPYPPGTMIPLQTNKYPRMHNYIDEAQHAYPQIPAMGGAGWRGMQQPMHIFRWPYTVDFGALIDIKSSLGMELRVWLENHIPFEGERAVATVYSRLGSE
jgi:hypothetical protein